jgi:arylsulfatase A-like enzyme
LFCRTAWVGLITGPLEVGLVLALKQVRDGTPGLFHMNRHILWMIPLSHLGLFAAVGLLLALLLRFRARFSYRRAAWFVGGLAALSMLLTIRTLHPIACAALCLGFAARSARRIESAVLRSGRLPRATFPVLVVAIPALAVFASGAMPRLGNSFQAGPGPAPGGSPNVVLVVMDTVRADHLSLYGYERGTSPQLARFARRGVRFAEARSTAPWTLPSHASLFTGRWPHELSAGFGGPLDGAVPTLAEFLRDHGYATGGFVANTLYCSAESGLGRGFNRYEDHEVSASGVLYASAIGQRFLARVGPFLARRVKAANTALRGALRGGEAKLAPHRPNKPYKDASRINRDALAWIDAQAGRPFFAFLNYFDAHTPYLLPKGQGRHFGKAPATREDFELLNDFWSLDKTKVTEPTVELARDAYDDCVAYLDEQLGRLVDELDRRGLLRNTVVIVTADHGEELGEHGLYGHASSLYRPEIHVPLVIVGPSGVPGDRVVAEPVSLRRIPATVVDLLHLSDPSPFPGSSLARSWRAGASRSDDAGEPVLSEVASPARNNPNQGRSPVFRKPLKALTDRGSVYIRGGDGSEELYDLEADRGEERNLARDPAAAAELARMRERLERTLGESAPAVR